MRVVGLVLLGAIRFEVRDIPAQPPRLACLLAIEALQIVLIAALMWQLRPGAVEAAVG